VLQQARERNLLSDEHFTVDGTLLEAATPYAGPERGKVRANKITEALRLARGVPGRLSEGRYERRLLSVVPREIKFSILKSNAGVPTLATCTGCQLKFFTPKAILRDYEAANEYLRQKYDEHECPARPKRDARSELLSILEPPIHRKKVG
jgi:hypothetical protein